MIERVLIAGSGGQGIVLIGRLLASAAVRTVPHVTFYPAYGAEVRGGTSNCQVILSTDEIDSPLSERVDAMVVMNQMSADRFLPCATSATALLLSRSLCQPPAGRGLRALMVPATQLAEEAGGARAANFVMLGAYLQQRPVVPSADLESAIGELMADKGAAVIDLNVRAFRAGADFARSAGTGQ